jgi:hypothetical protein
MDVFKTLFFGAPNSNSKWNGRLARCWNLGRWADAQPALSPGHGRDARVTLVFALSVVGFPLISSAQLGPVVPAPVASPASTGLAVVSHLDEIEKESALRDGKLLVHHRKNDPFSVPMRDKFRGLPPVVEKPLTSVAENAVAAAAPAPTLAQAVQQLPVGAVDPEGREMLIGSHLVHEGDLLMMELSGHRFVVWVQTIDQRGALFCDFDLKQRALRPFRTGPKDLATDAVEQQPDVQSFLQSNEK